MFSRSHWQPLGFGEDPSNYNRAPILNLMHWPCTYQEFLHETVVYETSILLNWVTEFGICLLAPLVELLPELNGREGRGQADMSPPLCYRKDRTWERETTQGFLNFLMSLENVHSSYKIGHKSCLYIISGPNNFVLSHFAFKFPWTGSWHILMWDSTFNNK